MPPGGDFRPAVASGAITAMTGRIDDRVPPVRRPGWSRAGKWLSLALSFGIHAVVLLMMVDTVAVSGDSGNFTVEIVQPTVPSSIPNDPPAAEPSKPPPIPTPASKPRSRAISAPKPVAEPPTAATDQPIGDQMAEPANTVVSAPSPPPPPDHAGTGGPSDDDGLRRYAQLIWARIAAHKPRGMKLPGTATVVFALAEDGGLISAEVIESDGDPALNRAALATVRAATPFPPPPAGATPAQLTFSVPFRFR